jgi:hypothetical protein
MTQKQLILHVGFHKSGTSSLQESFAKQRTELLGFGVLYPNIGKTAHHRVVWALSQKRWGWKNRGGDTTPYSVYTKMIRQINSSKEQTVVLSSEFFSELKPEQIQKISSAVKGREVKVLFTLRPLAKLLGSSYQQYLKYGIKADYSEWLHSVLDEPGVSKINPPFWLRHMHGEVIQKWAEVFGSGAVSVLVVDEQRPEFLFDEVNKLLSLPPNTLQAQKTGSNRSLSLEEIALLLQLNRMFPENRDWSEYLLFIRNGYIRQLTDRVPLKKDAAKLPTPTWAVKKANALATESKQKIISLGVQVLGDLDSLDSAQVLEGEPEYPVSIDIETVAASMLAFKKNITRRIPNPWYRQELIRRVKARLGIK